MYRFYVDNRLVQTSFYGSVIDIGGRKTNKVGQFIQPEDQVSEWKYLNINPENSPDFLCSADEIPVKSETFDIVLLSEVLEHLEQPYEVLNEIYRVLKPGGLFFITVPFMFHEHGSPFDFQRWTKRKIQMELESRGFQISDIEPLGGILSILYDNTMIYLKQEGGKKNFLIKACYKVFARILSSLSKLFYIIDNKTNKESIVSGYFVKAVK